MSSYIAASLGFPRIGVGRELKKAVESYWGGKASAEELAETARLLRQRHWLLAKDAGIDHVPSNDFSLYDHMLDAAVTFGVVPKRYAQIPDAMHRYFAMARGLQDRASGVDIPALEMTKWFDTNYHYIVPEVAADQVFRLDARKILAEIAEARALGIETRPVIPGPVTFLLLSKASHPGKKPLDFLDALLPVYDQLLALLAEQRVAWVQIDEPGLVLDLDDDAKAAYGLVFTRWSANHGRPRIMLTTYFGALGDNLPLVAASEVDGLHIDLVRAPEQLGDVLSHLRPKTFLSLGLVDGRNIWRTNLDQAAALVQSASAAIDVRRLIIAPSCSLLHCPVDLQAENRLDAELKGWLAFATQKLGEIREIANGTPSHAYFATRAALASRAGSLRTRDPLVRAKLRAVTPAMLVRTPFKDRRTRQIARFCLPTLPTTTIGSFPQTGDVRSARAAWRAGKSSAEAYEAFLQNETKVCIERQEAIGLDVLVHGEFERTDMVEYFGEQLEGFAFTENGWVQSYGSRCVKPPVLYGDVARPQAMTVAWARYAQSLTAKPVKGMLTGPVTILQWSFVRDDQPRRDTCLQIALALREEVQDLEAAGVGMIQVDEPAIREGLPLRRGDWKAYLSWAVDAFRLATAGVQEETQIHTHMCYAEFGDILDAVAAMDADVLSIETSRSQMELLDDFDKFRYPNDVGPGVYDIHSPRLPTQREIEELLGRAAEVLPPERLWVNPDCGLKTRGWPEVEAALRSMVEAAREVRGRLES